jgi:hypothetical protein
VWSKGAGGLYPAGVITLDIEEVSNG